MKKVLAVLLCLSIFLGLSACTFNPPEGWTRTHHTYEEVLAFAKSIDPNATVTEGYTDTVDENDWKFREWDAVIHGVHCHVASVTDWVWNSGFAAGEFAESYYRIDTDYDYTVMRNILSEKYPDWNCERSLHSKYHSNNIVFACLVLPEFRMLRDDELEEVWKTACQIHEEYEKVALGREAWFCIPSPGEYWHGEQSIVKLDSHAYITAFTEEGKVKFLQEYKENWALLESGLPTYD